jgi:hypothetical protein
MEMASLYEKKKPIDFHRILEAKKGANNQPADPQGSRIEEGQKQGARAAVHFEHAEAAPD